MVWHLWSLHWEEVADQGWNKPFWLFGDKLPISETRISLLDWLMESNTSVKVQ